MLPRPGPRDSVRGRGRRPRPPIIRQRFLALDQHPNGSACTVSVVSTYCGEPCFGVQAEAIPVRATLLVIGERHRIWQLFLLATALFIDGSRLRTTAHAIQKRQKLAGAAISGCWETTRFRSCERVPEMTRFPCGMTVRLVGRFARLPRRLLEAWLASLGATLVADGESAADLLVVGSLGWPLCRSGRLPRSLILARICQARGPTPDIIAEQTFWQRCDDAGTTPSLPMAGSGSPLIAKDSDILELASAQRKNMLARLLAQGVKPRRLRRSLAQLARWLPTARDDWEQLSPRTEGSRLLFRLPEGAWVEPSGQLLFDFDAQEKDDGSAMSLLFTRPTAECDLFALAVAAEQRGDLLQAEEHYRQLLAAEGPDADVCFNLANVLVARGERGAAMERLWQAVELAPRFAEAWYNLGTVALERGQVDAAHAAFSRAVSLSPSFGEARLGLVATAKSYNVDRPPEEAVCGPASLRFHSSRWAASPAAAANSSRPKGSDTSTSDDVDGQRHDLLCD